MGGGSNLFVYDFTLGFAVFSITFCVIYLSFLDWDEREDRVGSILKISLVAGVLIAMVFSAILVGLSDKVLVEIYRELILSTFILTLMMLYPFISWARKQVYSHFYVTVYISYDVLLWFIFPPFFYSVMGLKKIQVVIANYVTGAIMGTLLATAIMREVRAKEVIFGSLPTITTAITIADFSARAFSSVLPDIPILGILTINTVHLFLPIAVIIQYFYYKKVVE